LYEYLPHITILALLDTLVLVLLIPFILLTKKESTAAVAWCLVVILMPLLGALLFWVFGYNHVFRPLRQKLSHRAHYRREHPPPRHEATRGEKGSEAGDPTWQGLGSLALTVNAFPPSPRNAVTLYKETEQAFAAKLDAVQAARHHVHLEYFIIRSDETGTQLLELLTAKAKAGVQVRLLFDSWGALKLKRRLLRPLLAAGGQAVPFLPLNPLRSWIQVNLRNHRKILVADGRVAFTGGMNIGNEYLGKNPAFGYWRDTVLRLEGPAVAGFQRIFAEDWHFAAREPLDGPDFFPTLPAAGDSCVQVIESGPDQPYNSIREVYFAAILAARQRVWIATPYFVPDAGLLDALRLARFRGVEVRLLCLLRPDHFLSFYATRYYWTDMLALGVKIYQYAKGMMHSKLMMVDGKWAMMGSANLDNRSLHLNFEAGCILHTTARVAELEAAFERDLSDSLPLDADVFAHRSLASRLAENACRLFSPIL
jgi:cardiolipin synthase